MRRLRSGGPGPVCAVNCCLYGGCYCRDAAAPLMSEVSTANRPTAQAIERPFWSKIVLLTLASVSQAWW